MSETDKKMRSLQFVVYIEQDKEAIVEDAIFFVENFITLSYSSNTHLHKEKFSSCAKFLSKSGRHVRVSSEQLVFILIDDTKRRGRRLLLPLPLIRVIDNNIKIRIIMLIIITLILLMVRGKT